MRNSEKKVRNSRYVSALGATLYIEGLQNHVDDGSVESK